MNKCGIVLLSRFSSSRLPGKALIEINGKTVLEYIIERLIQVFPLDRIIIATSIDETDDEIEKFARDYGINIFRGPLENVARRFYEAAKSQGWDYAIRINGDNIFVEIELLREMKSICEISKFDLLSNVKGRTFPKGMSIEIVKLSHFKKYLLQIESKKEYFEHVTAFLYENDFRKNYIYFINVEYPCARNKDFALDTSQDLERISSIISTFEKEHFKYNMVDIMNLTYKK